MRSNGYENLIFQAYARKSSETEERQVQSIERQTEDFWKFYDKEGITNFSDPIEESRSAYTLGRPGFKQLVDLTMEGKVNAWWSWDVNRLARNAVDGGLMIHLMDLKKLYLIQTRSRVYYNTPTDKMMLLIEVAMSKKDSDDKSDAVKSGLRVRYRKGFPNGRAAIGFINTTWKEKGDREWIVDQDRLDKVSILLQKFLTGRYSVNSIAEYARNTLELNTYRGKGVKTPLVANSTVHEFILLNPIYAGFFFANDEEGVKRRHPLEANLPRLITESEHLRILQILGKRTAPKRTKHQCIYSPFLRTPDGYRLGQDVKHQVICDCKKKFAYLNCSQCPNCKVTLRNMKHPKYLTYTYYYNVHRRKQKGVTAKTVSESKLEKYLVNYFDSNFATNQELCDWGKNYLYEKYKEDVQQFKSAQKKRQELLDSFNTQKKVLRKQLRDGDITKLEYKEDLSDIQTEESKIINTPLHTNWYQEAQKILDAAVEVCQILQRGSSEEKSTLMNDLSSNLIWNEEKLNIINTKPMDAYIKGLQKAKAKNSAFEPKNIVDFKGSNKVFMSVRPVLLRALDRVRTCLIKARSE